MALSESDIEAFRNEISETSNSVATTVTTLILSGVSPYGIVFGLMKVAAFIAKATGCPEEIFLRLATVSYTSNAKVSGTEQYIDKLNKIDKPKGRPN